MRKKPILNELLLLSFLSNGSVCVRLCALGFFFTLDWLNRNSHYASTMNKPIWFIHIFFFLLHIICVYVFVCRTLYDIKMAIVCNQFVLSKWCGWIFITKVIVNGNWTQSRPINGHFVLHLQPENGHYLLHTKARSNNNKYRPDRKRFRWNGSQYRTKLSAFRLFYYGFCRSNWFYVWWKTI